MKMSRHAGVRLQQRGFKQSQIDLILKNGTPRKKFGEVLEFRLNKKDKIRIIKQLKKVIQSLDKCSNKAILIDANVKEIITMYNLL